MSADKKTRKNKYEKRRKNTKLISILLVIGIILVIALISIWLFGGGDSEPVEESEQVQSEMNTEEEQDETDNPVNGNEENENPSLDNESESDDEIGEVKTDEVEPSDENVSKAYEGNWNPVGTEQEGPHTVNYDEGSQDRQEMTRAILLGTGLIENDYREWWVANGGDQKVVATVSNSAETEIYRVYLSWVDGEGWKPTKIEELKENDWKKYQ